MLGGQNTFLSDQARIVYVTCINYHKTNWHKINPPNEGKYSRGGETRIIPGITKHAFTTHILRSEPDSEAYAMHVLHRMFMQEGARSAVEVKIGQ